MVNINRNLTFTNAELIKKQPQVNQQAQPQTVAENNQPKLNEELKADLLKIRGFEDNKPKGKTFTRGLFQWPLEIIDTNVKGAKTFWKAITKGEGNDKDIGSLNDFALGLTGLGIAASLARRPKTAPFAAAMEFVGFGTWFASQAIWPKVILAKPVEFFTGVNINKTYEHSEGKTNRILTDPQYIPWDLYSQEELNKVGKKCHIPDNIKDRNKHIQDKIRQVGVQSNTLWMLTAGFSTPLISSLLADQLRPAVANTLENVNEFRESVNLFGVKRTLHDRIDKALNNLSPFKSFLNASKRVIGNVDGNVSDLMAKKGENAANNVAKALESQLEKGVSKEQLHKFLGDNFKSIEHTDLYKHIFETADSLHGDNAKLVSLVKEAKKFVVMSDLVKNYAKTTLGNVPDSALAHVWDKAPKEMLDAIKLPNNIRMQIKQIQGQTTNTTSDVAKLINDHLSSLPKVEKEAAEEALNKVIAKYDKKISHFAERLGVEFADDGIKTSGLLKDLAKQTETLKGHLTANSNSAWSAQTYMDDISEMVRNRVVDMKTSFYKANMFFEKLGIVKTSVKNLEGVENYGQQGLKEIFNALSKKINVENLADENAKNAYKALEKALKSQEGLDPHHLATVIKDVPVEEFNEIFTQFYGKEADNGLRGAIRFVKTELFKSIYEANNFGAVLTDFKLWNKEKLASLVGDDLAARLQSLDDKVAQAAKDELGKLNLWSKIDKVKNPIEAKLNALNSSSTIKSNAMNDIRRSLEGVLDDTSLNKFFKNRAYLPEKMDMDNELAKRLKQTSAWLGKRADDLFADAAKESVLYRGWLAKVGLAFGALTGITLLATSMMGKKNKYNPGVYEVREAKSYE